jgi:hypothetical protein
MNGVAGEDDQEEAVVIRHASAHCIGRTCRRSMPSLHDGVVDAIPTRIQWRCECRRLSIRCSCRIRCRFLDRADAVNRPHPSLAGLELQTGLSLAVEIVKCSAMIFNLPWTFTSGRWIHVDASAVDRTATAAPLTGECW